MDNKKERIINAAIEVFSERGIEKTKISDIVKNAGIAQGTYYNYFSSKLAVMPSIAEVMMEKMLVEIKEKISENESFSKQLSHVIDITFSITKEYREIFALIYAGLASTEYLQDWEAIYAPYYSWMSKFLLKATEAGHLRKNLDPEQTAILLIGLIESAAEQTYLYSHGDANMAEVKKREVLEFVGYALGVEK